MCERGRTDTHFHLVIALGAEVAFGQPEVFRRVVARALQALVNPMARCIPGL